jgi:hypothetical protein
MVMDYLRAGYTAPARWQSTGDSTITLRWYRAAEGAQVYLLPHAFGSSVWDDLDYVAVHGPGEIGGTYAWSPSPANVPPGLSTKTPASWLQLGVPVGTPAPPCDTHVFVSACSCFSVLQS